MTITSDRRTAGTAALLIALGGLSARGDSAGPEIGAGATEEVHDLREQVGALDDRVAALETEAPGDRRPDQPVRVDTDGARIHR